MDLQKELEYRRKKQWDIFSWCSTLLVAITAGVIALRTREPAYLPSWQAKVIISLSVSSILTYAVVWISHNWEQEIKSRERLGEKMKDHTRPYFGYRGALVLLAIASLLACWISDLGTALPAHDRDQRRAEPTAQK